jgi:hypothetical protein
MTEPTATNPSTSPTGPSAPGDVANTITKDPAYKTPTPASELLRSDAGDVEATTVTMDRSGAEQVTAERVVMTKSGARTVEARSVQMDDSGAMSVQAEQAVLQSGSALAIIAEEARVVNSKVGVVSAGTATFEPGSRIVLFAGNAEGEVRTVVDAAGAAAFGAALGVVLLLLGRLIRRLTS